MTPIQSALSNIEKIFARVGERVPTVFLDYDGTLTPIVDRPELAILSPKMRSTMEALARHCPVAIISGRGRQDVESLVALDGIYYAGSHGFDIKGPGVEKVPEKVLSILPLVEKTYQELIEKTRKIKGSLIENKKFALAVHYRLVAEREIPTVEKIVDEIASREKELRKTTGKMVFELRANIPWDKGKAVLYLLETLTKPGQKSFPFYLGDDDTDEDAFAAIKGLGIGILVSDSPRVSVADYQLKDTEETAKFLELLTDWLKIKQSE